jgi:enamine deaminase RidA (YjgF/YER057c/UK114 family)
VKVVRVTALPAPEWLALRSALWPHHPDVEHEAEMADFVAAPWRFAQFLAYDAGDRAVGLVEASIRHDYVNGTAGSPVAFLEGLYVEPASRRSGVARGLVETVANWARQRGCHELASDTQLENELSQRVHARLGFIETERVVYFVRQLGQTADQTGGTEDRMSRRLISSGSSYEQEIGYSRAVAQGDWIFVSGTTGFDYATMTIADDIETQTERCLENIAAALAQADASLADIVRVRYILPDGEEFPRCWPVLRKYFGEVWPAATMIEARLLDPRMRIEIEVTALRRG